MEVHLMELGPDGLRVIETRTAYPERCPFFIFDPSHYRENGACLCTNAEHRELMIREWDYSSSDFASVPLID